MLVDLLDQSIIAMKEIYELEKSSNDVQKQEKNDKIFSNVVSENHLMVKAVCLNWDLLSRRKLGERLLACLNHHVMQYREG